MASTATQQVPITSTEYAGLQTAYDFFNGRLFGGTLPQCLVTLQRVKRAEGYFWPQQFRHRRGDQKTDEIALNPDVFERRTDEQVLSTLVHEMVHLWQAHHGKPGRRGYHNQQWADKMKGVGLQPSHTGQPGGRETGEHMSDYVMKGGVFAVAYAELAGGGWALNWNATPALRNGGKPGRPKQTRVKFSCPGCGLNVWGKPDARVACVDCSEDDGDMVLMEPAA